MGFVSDGAKHSTPLFCSQRRFDGAHPSFKTRGGGNEAEDQSVVGWKIEEIPRMNHNALVLEQTNGDRFVVGTGRQAEDGRPSSLGAFYSGYARFQKRPIGAHSLLKCVLKVVPVCQQGRQGMLDRTVYR